MYIINCQNLRCDLTDIYVFVLIDSKTLTEQQREKLFNTINENKDFIGWAIEILSPNYLSNAMLRRYLYLLPLSNRWGPDAIVVHCEETAFNFFTH